MKKSVALAFAGLLCAPAVHAFEVTGGEVSLGYSGLTGSSVNDVTKTAMGGSLEFGIAPGFSVQGDLGLSKFGRTDSDSHSMGLHAIYHVNEATSVGGFLGRDRIDGTNLDFFGVEIGHQIGQFGAEGYIGHAEIAGGSGTVLGMEGNYALGDTATVGLRYDNIDLGNLDTSRLSLTGEIGVLPGLSLTGEIGSADVAGFDSEMFAGIGVRVNFGDRRGTTFRDRSVMNLLPGL